MCKPANEEKQAELYGVRKGEVPFVDTVLYNLMTKTTSLKKALEGKGCATHLMNVPVWSNKSVAGWGSGSASGTLGEVHQSFLKWGWRTFDSSRMMPDGSRPTLGNKPMFMNVRGGCKLGSFYRCVRGGAVRGCPESLCDETSRRTSASQS